MGSILGLSKGPTQKPRLLTIKFPHFVLLLSGYFELIIWQLKVKEGDPKDNWFKLPILHVVLSLILATDVKI